MKTSQNMINDQGKYSSKNTRYNLTSFPRDQFYIPTDYLICIIGEKRMWPKIKHLAQEKQDCLKNKCENGRVLIVRVQSGGEQLENLSGGESPHLWSLTNTRGQAELESGFKTGCLKGSNLFELVLRISNSSLGMPRTVMLTGGFSSYLV